MCIVALHPWGWGDWLYANTKAGYIRTRPDDDMNNDYASQLRVPRALFLSLTAADFRKASTKNCDFCYKYV